MKAHLYLLCPPLHGSPTSTSDQEHTFVIITTPKWVIWHYCNTAATDLYKKRAEKAWILYKTVKTHREILNILQGVRPAQFLDGGGVKMSELASTPKERIAIEDAHWEAVPASTGLHSVRWLNLALRQSYKKADCSSHDIIVSVTFHYKGFSCSL